MRTAEIRKRWLDYFEAQGHAVVPSASLISPDPSTLFTIAGMVPFIPYMTAQQTPPWKRATSVQKCVRTLDIDDVGKTTRHGTFFQMNGNFSFGDYFKADAIRMAWDFLTGSLEDGKLGIDPDKLWVTVYYEDDEARQLWKDIVGLPDERIQGLGKKDNYWSTGQPGPAGPCSEIFYDRGAAYGPDGGPLVDEGGDRFVEIWNLVFMQYAIDDVKSKEEFRILGELENKNIDTGMGLERVAFLLQGKDNMYEIDEVFPVIEAAAKLSGKTYGENHDDDVRMRVVADHVRSALMIIGDGVRPSNEGRGYVLRRLLRRSVRAMRLLGVDGVALTSLLPVSKDAMAPSYPELATNFEQISAVAYAEEEAFRRTLVSGTGILDNAVANLKKQGGDHLVLPGDAAFQLHDTYGFPIDLTLEMAAEQGVQVDEQAFRSLMQEQRTRARADALAKRTGGADVAAYESLEKELTAPVEFLGYTQTDASVRVAGLLTGGVPAPAVTAPAEIEVVLDRTPFYAEAGGQLADHGTIVLDGGATIEVDDVQRPIKGLSVHRGRLIEGTVALGDPGTAQIDTSRRKAISRAHSATHMIHKALHELVGEDRTQAGSENAPSRIRFDFRSPSAVSTSALTEIEERVNVRLADNLEVTDQLMPIAQAREAGAMALFGEKYGDVVRVVSIGDDWSRELCAGTHVKQTGQLGRVTLLGESSIGSGVRRVDALVGDGAYGFQAKEHALVGQLTGLLNTRAEDLHERVGSLVSRLKEAEKELAALRQGQLLAAAGKLAAEAPRVGDVRVVTHDAGEAQADDLRALVLDVRGRLGEAEPVVAAAGGVSGGRPVVVVVTNAAARAAGYKAGDLVRTAAQTLGGGGGGKPDMAQGGGTDPAKLGEALAGIAEGVRLAAVGA
ncbi:alanine--tRNA ligase [Promicromonospora sukumoe]|uniref:Alanine--tRNA ligase n=1 Tax=Promicromonospora sukumoe TaxID=88382 RepID=A0A7W3J805_9MICO|nr:alanine--tRNA ligase [Promicromonospora sukumoe]MBA8807938.1 alanyl-tRNA synthetase [Promicromonospora sukumoe]